MKSSIVHAARCLQRPAIKLGSQFSDLRLYRLAGVLAPLSLTFRKQGTTGKSRALEGRRISSKSPSRVPDRDEGVAERHKRE